MKILVAGDWYCPPAALQESFASLATRHEVTFAEIEADSNWKPKIASELRVKEYLGNPNEFAKKVIDHDILVVHAAPVTDAVLSASPKLKLVCVTRGGPVNIDVRAATERGIPIVTTPGKNADAVADLTMALMIMVARRLPEAIRFVEGNNDFGRDNFEGAKWFGHDLAGHALGLIGFGQVGRRVASRALAFGMHVLVFDPVLSPDAIRTSGIDPTDLEVLLATADFVSLHARATRENRGMIGQAEFARMKQGAYFINTARDSLVDEDALWEALKAGRLGGAAFDVVQPPKVGQRHRLLDSPNVVIVPHIGGSTYETLSHGGEMAAAEIERFLRGEPLVNVANPEVLASARGAAS